jgi:Ca2+-binding EF-hand superfamily protein
MKASWRKLLLFFAIANLPHGLLDEVEEELELPADGDEEPLQDEDLPISSETLRSMHAKMDGNSDGQVSMTEALEFALQMRFSLANKDMAMVLDELDESKDGKLTEDEFVHGIHKQDAKKADAAEIALEREKFKLADENGNGHLEVDELAGVFYPETNEKILALVVQDEMKKREKDGDGVLSVKEFWEHSGEEGEEITPEQQLDFDNYDVDKSGTLSFDEMKEWESGRLLMNLAMEELFKAADKDGDKHMTVDEFGKVGEEIVGLDAHYHIQEWANHEL